MALTKVVSLLDGGISLGRLGGGKEEEVRVSEKELLDGSVFTGGLAAGDGGETDDLFSSPGGWKWKSLNSGDTLVASGSESPTHSSEEI